LIVIANGDDDERNENGLSPAAAEAALRRSVTFRISPVLDIDLNPTAARPTVRALPQPSVLLCFRGSCSHPRPGARRDMRVR